MRAPLRIGPVGFGWMGQANSRSYRSIPLYFPDIPCRKHQRVGV